MNFPGFSSLSFDNKNYRHLTFELMPWIKRRVSRFGACASDDVAAVKLIVFGPIRSEYTTWDTAGKPYNLLALLA